MLHWESEHIPLKKNRFSNAFSWHFNFWLIFHNSYSIFLKYSLNSNFLLHFRNVNKQKKTPKTPNSVNSQPPNHFTKSLLFLFILLTKNSFLYDLNCLLKVKQVFDNFENSLKQVKIWAIVPNSDKLLTHPITPLNICNYFLW